MHLSPHLPSLVVARLLARAALLALCAACAPAAFAWSNHTLGAWPALAGMPELHELAPVRVESLETFLAAEAANLEAVLDAEERWAREHVPVYPPRPDALRFTAAGAAGPGELQSRFIAAVRIAPDSRLGLFLQRLPGDPPDGRAGVPARNVTTLARDHAVESARYAALREGEAVSSLAVLATACDEPDYGLDIGLWEDNGTPQGRLYGFGKQPFGNPALDFGSQAPFHMGFYHEAAIIYAAAGFLKRTYPEYRIHLWKTLALHALRTGHDYWGWRFAGWALHYLQDLTQPYHARVLPGVGTARMLWINALHMAGWPRARDQAVTLVSNRHLALENFARTAMISGGREIRGAGPLVEALAGRTAVGGQTAYDDDSPRAVVSRHAADAADEVDRIIAASLPARYVDDPGFEFGVAEDGIDLYASLGRDDPAKRDAMMRMLAPLMAEFGTHTRAFVRALLADPGLSDAMSRRGARSPPGSS
ncbi:MAG: hypothetical protein J0H00_16805 [Burkholderiales bacterium]|nr:hypothetical protein [Burkholderiales bacterium]OJX05093.1 MAG: hypothetical protein BGO72_15100 [Burkholderiales bacterium 70-64]